MKWGVITLFPTMVADALAHGDAAWVGEYHHFQSKNTRH